MIATFLLMGLVQSGAAAPDEPYDEPYGETVAAAEASASQDSGQGEEDTDDIVVTDGPPARDVELLDAEEAVRIDDTPAGPPFRSELTRELFRGRHAVPTPKGEFQYRAMVFRTDGDVDFNAGLEFGLTDTITLGFELLPHPTTVATFEGLGVSGPSDDIGLSVMKTFTHDESTAVSARLDVVFQSDSSLFGTVDGDRVEYRPSVAVAHKTRSGSEVHGGVGIAVADEPGDTERILYDFAFVAPLTSAVAGIVEVDGGVGDNDFHEIYLTPGVVFSPKERLQVQVGAAIGLTGDSADYQILLGMTVAF